MANELQPEEGTTEVDEVVQSAVAEIPEQELPELISLRRASGRQVRSASATEYS